MILSLHIENIAVVKSLDIDMRGGFTVLSGETGAGKSIIVDSLGLLAGARADRELVRTGERTGEVSALFGNIGNAARETIAGLGFSTEDDTALENYQRRFSVYRKSERKGCVSFGAQGDIFGTL